MSSSYLQYVITGCIFMTHGTGQRCSKGRASQSRSESATRIRSTARGRRADGTRMFHLSPPGVSLPPTSGTAEGAAGRQRTEVGLYGETGTQFDSAGPVVRICQEPLHQRSGQPCLARSAATRARAWLRAAPLETFALNIGLIVCLKISWHRSFRPWRQKSSGSLAQSPKPGRA